MKQEFLRQANQDELCNQSLLRLHLLAEKRNLYQKHIYIKNNIYICEKLLNNLKKGKSN